MRCAFIPNMSFITKGLGVMGKYLVFMLSLCRQTDGWTMAKQYALNLTMRGHKKEKMLVTSIFSFSHFVFEKLLPHGFTKSGLFGNHKISALNHPIEES